MKDTSRACVLRGLAEMCGGAACLLAVVAVFAIATRPPFFPLTLLVLGFITLTADGLVSLSRSRRFARFR
jgi:hypothetical protein